jgi:hypothetical protein
MGSRPKRIEYPLSNYNFIYPHGFYLSRLVKVLFNLNVGKDSTSLYWFLNKYEAYHEAGAPYLTQRG